MRTGMPHIASIFLLISVAGCGEEKSAVDGRPATGISFARQVQPILDTNCVQCHMTGAAQGGLILEEGLSHAALADVQSTEAPMKRVAPGNSRASYFYLKLTGEHLQAGGQGSGMPMVEGIYKPLDATSLATIRSWIESGANNN